MMQKQRIASQFLLCSDVGACSGGMVLTPAVFFRLAQAGSP